MKNRCKWCGTVHRIGASYSCGPKEPCKCGHLYGEHFQGGPKLKECSACSCKRYSKGPEKKPTPSERFNTLLRKYENDPEYIIEGMELAIDEMQAKLKLLKRLIKYKEKP